MSPHETGGGARPSVTAVVTNHDYAEYLPSALDSVLAQRYEGPLDVVVVDDGSTDDSLRVLDGYADRVTVVRQENRGQLLALREGMARATGDVVCFLDADDAWTPDRVARTVEAFRRSSVRWAAHGMTVCDGALRPAGPVVPPLGRAGRVPGDPLLFLERRAGAATSALAVRADLARELVAELGHLAEQYGATLRYDADRVLLALVGLARAPGWQLAAPLALYRRHERQQFAAPARRLALLERQVEVDRLVGQIVSRKLGKRLVPTPVYRHRLVLAGLSGERGRWRMLLAGLRAVGPLVRRHPVLAGRQALSLVRAAAAPRAWFRSVAARQGLEP